MNKSKHGNSRIHGIITVITEGFASLPLLVLTRDDLFVHKLDF